MWGSPGTMLAAQVMHERTGAPVWAEAWNASADHLWAAWDGELWHQDLYGSAVTCWGRRTDLPGTSTCSRAATCSTVSGGASSSGVRSPQSRGTPAARTALRNWPPGTRAAIARSAGDDPDAVVSRCSGIVASLASLAQDDDQLTELLVAGGELTWRAGPLKKGAGLCHGTAGNGYAFLKLFERTGDELWLDRARAFAMHAIEQVERATAHYGRGRHTLWTGDPGTALYLQNCITGNAAFPTLDSF